MLNKKDLERLVDTTYNNEDTDIGEDLVLWEIDPDALRLILSELARDTIKEIAETRTAFSPILIAAICAFGFGYKCAMEVEMQRIANSETRD
jgi:hypothetical protein